MLTQGMVMDNLGILGFAAWYVLGGIYNKSPGDNVTSKSGVNSSLFGKSLEYGIRLLLLFLKTIQSVSPIAWIIKISDVLGWSEWGLKDFEFVPFEP